MVASLILFMLYYWISDPDISANVHFFIISPLSFHAENNLERRNHPFDQTRGHADISAKAMDAHWQQSKVCDTMVTPSRPWTLTSSGETHARYLYTHLVKHIYLSQTYIDIMTKIST
jgi:hypothetical protein